MCGCGQRGITPSTSIPIASLTAPAHSIIFKIQEEFQCLLHNEKLFLGKLVPVMVKGQPRMASLNAKAQPASASFMQREITAVPPETIAGCGYGGKVSNTLCVLRLLYLLYTFTAVLLLYKKFAPFFFNDGQ